MSLYFDSLFKKLTLSYGRLFGVSWFQEIFNRDDYSNHFIKNRIFEDSYFGFLQYYFFNAGVIDFLTLGILPFIEFNLLYANLVIRSKYEPLLDDGKKWTTYIIPFLLIAISLVGIILLSTYLVRFCFAISMLLIFSPFITLYHAYRFNELLKKTYNTKLSIINESWKFEFEKIQRQVAPNLSYEIIKPKVVSVASLLNNQEGLSYDYHQSEKGDFIFSEYNHPGRKYLFHIYNVEYQKNLYFLLWADCNFLDPLHYVLKINRTVLFKNNPLRCDEELQRDLTGWNKDALQLGGVECIQLMYIINKNRIPSEVARIILLYLVDSQFKIKTDMGIECATQNAHVFFGNKAQKFYNERQNAGLSNYNLF